MIQHLPTVNACLNGIAAALLVAGFVSIRQGNKERHKRLMVAAVGVSVLFLTSYLTYHFLKAGMVTRYAKQDWTRPLYLTILLSHTLLAAATPFLVAFTLVRAVKGDFERHRRIARITFPIWLYVSVTGVVIYLMLYTFEGRG